MSVFAAPNHRSLTVIPSGTRALIGITGWCEMNSGLAVTFTVVYLSLCRVLPGHLNYLLPSCVWVISEEYLTLGLWVTTGFNGYGRGWFVTSQLRVKWKEGWPTRSLLLRICSSHNRASFASDVTTCVSMVTPSIIVWRFCRFIIWRDVWKFYTNLPSPPPPVCTTCLVYFINPGFIDRMI
jgi:hypothetical protein